MKSIIRHAILLLLLVGAPLLAQTNIDPTNKYAWGENIGWTNWRDANGGADGVFVGATFLSGQVWSESRGWINVGNGAGPYANTDDTNFGVNIDLNGDLNGFAWGENMGWINFGWATAGNPDRPRFDAGAGRFRGFAWSEQDGWINLDDAVSFVGGPGGVPTVSQWGLLILTLLLLTGGTIVFRMRQIRTA